MHILFYSNEHDTVSFVLSGAWTHNEIICSLAEVVSDDGILLEQPVEAMGALRSTMSRRGLDITQYKVRALAHNDLVKVLRNQPPSDYEQWLLVDIPWGNITVCDKGKKKTMAPKDWKP